MIRVLLGMLAAFGVLSADLSAERWLIERGPSPADLSADSRALAAAAELLVRRDPTRPRRAQRRRAHLQVRREERHRHARSQPSLLGEGRRASARRPLRPRAGAGCARRCAGKSADAEARRDGPRAEGPLEGVDGAAVGGRSRTGAREGLGGGRGVPRAEARRGGIGAEGSTPRRSRRSAGPSTRRTRPSARSSRGRP